MRSDGKETLVISSQQSVLSQDAAPAACQRVRDLWMLVLIIAGCFSVTAHAEQYYNVDCTGANPSYFPTITAALNSGIGPGSFILVNGTCTENVVINSVLNLSIGAYYGSTANVVGNISVSDSDSVYFYGLNVSNPSGDGFDIVSSRGVILDTCTSNGNKGHGLNESNLSEVTMSGTGAFDNNGLSAILLGNSMFYINSWAGPTDISNNVGQGAWITMESSFFSLGNVTISNNAVPINSSTTQPVFGVTSLGHSVVQLGDCEGSNTIQGNQAGGFDIEEGSELSIFNCGTTFQNNVLANGPVGISAGFGSQVTIDVPATISGHSAEGVELYGNSQLNLEGAVVVSKNGVAGEPRSAGIVVDGNSEAYLRGGQLTNNYGPGLLVLVNSSTDFTGTTFSDNSGGPIHCDSSAWIVTDESAGNSGGSGCPVPHRLGNRHSWRSVPGMPDSTWLKKRHAQYIKLANGKPH